MSADLEQRIVQVIRTASQVGSPVAPNNEAKATELANIARRRCGSFARRSKPRRSGKAEQIADLATGLALYHYDGDLSLVGPLMHDYEWLAERIMEVMD